MTAPRGVAPPAIRSFPWYDSQWLAAWHKVRDHLVDCHTEHLDEFDRVTDVFRTSQAFSAGWTDLIDADLHARLVSHAATIAASRLEHHERRHFGRTVVHDDPFFTEVQLDLANAVGDLVGEPVDACYNFLSLYAGDGRCAPHLDAPEAKWTIDHCLGRSTPWPLHVSRTIDWPDGLGFTGASTSTVINDPTLEFRAFAQEPGDTLVFSGSAQWHYRDPLPSSGDWGHFLFLHYAPAGTAELVRPNSWAERFGLPCLAPLTAGTEW